ncbi:MAG: single-stranded DNA-binding protein [Bacteroidetes bacterium GWF2_43_63]|nr:MAG: single-stranded DNA-binding protein [Bacteroidetes bacterium GWE2_42_42]OFY53158.1 MAG: single-stranded DNA-binding protein [Bacteroidetes bacterium GWF2_43_63]HBG70327.1 single-stranded DNA-binding protein [Bacteroidales bacterium]HCB60626.1 single-stranded DNA-binding protein [Bacteroidales bacterium]HCY22995.1 single-stranded DNA-binding protein [Bacteroidales bacterium]
MRSINKVILIGNVGKDPEVKIFEGGRKKASFSLATTEKYRDKAGAEQSVTEWHNIAVWGPQAEVIEKYVRRGSPLFVEGRIQYREYTDKDGVKKRFTEITLDNFSMLGTRSAQDGGTEITNTNTSADSGSDPLNTPLNNGNDDLPF